MKQETAEKAIVNGKALSLHEKDLVHITVGQETSMTKTQRQNALEKFALQMAIHSSLTRRQKVKTADIAVQQQQQQLAATLALIKASLQNHTR
ncbi:hypothetical protein QFC24_000411 [Naganishia onofrii]|uniref:Uncharacterized protein n=1 Tax=Naganishia onofrii TaxID=1851511 RepID=A0ACC2XX21_9TREE|nr:hypothetical protein QFC24_000411 [Naganishia onofrii]